MRTKGLILNINIQNNHVRCQKEASEQPAEAELSEFYKYQDFFKSALSQNQTLGFCDNRYANGGDRALVEFMQMNVSLWSSFEQVSYAGWACFHLN